MKQIATDTFWKLSEKMLLSIKEICISACITRHLGSDGFDLHNTPIVIIKPIIFIHAIFNIIAKINSGNIAIISSAYLTVFLSSLIHLMNSLSLQFNGLEEAKKTDFNDPSTLTTSLAIFLPRYLIATLSIARTATTPQINRNCIFILFKFFYIKSAVFKIQQQVMLSLKSKEHFHA